MLQLDENRPLGAFLTNVMDQTFRDRLSEEFDECIGVGDSRSLLFIWAGRIGSELSPALVILCSDRNQKKAIHRYCLKLQWLRRMMRENGFNLHVELDTAVQAATTAAPTTQQVPLDMVETNLIVPLYASTLCGMSVRIAAPGKPDIRESTFGGFLVIGNSIYGTLAKHPFDPFVAPPVRKDDTTEKGLELLDEDAEESESDEMTLTIGFDDSETAEDWSSQGDSNFSAGGSTTNIEGPSQISATRTNYLSLDLNVLLPTPSYPDSDSYTYDVDLAFADLARIPPHVLHMVLLPNKASDNAIEDFMTEVADESVPVIISAAGLEPRRGMLSPHSASLQFKNSKHNVKLITTESFLPMGCSGAWVTTGAKLCGFVIAIHERRPWAYMIPIDQLIAEARRIFNTDEIRLPTVEEMASLRERKSTSLVTPCPEPAMPENLPLQEATAPISEAVDEVFAQSQGGNSGIEAELLPLLFSKPSNVVFPGFSPPVPASTATDNILLPVGDVLSFLGAHGLDAVKQAWDLAHPEVLHVESFQFALVDALPDFFTAVVNELASAFVRVMNFRTEAGDTTARESQGLATQREFVLRAANSGDILATKENLNTISSSRLESKSTLTGEPAAKRLYGGETEEQDSTNPLSEGNKFKKRKASDDGKFHRTFSVITSTDETRTSATEGDMTKAVTLLGSGQRQTTNRVRLLGACLRCVLEYERCDDFEECKRCRVPSPNWKLGCVRIWLDGRLSSFQPDMLGENLTLSNFNTFKDLNSGSKYFSIPPFPLRLGWGIGPNITILVKEIDPSGEQLPIQNAFRFWSTTNEEAEVSCIELDSPSLLPHLTSDGPYGLDDTLKQIKTWVDEVLDKSNDNYDLVWHLFLEESEEWQRETLLIIWDYHRRSFQEHQVLTDALKLVALNHALTYAVIVPEEEVPRLYSHLRNPLYHNRSPRSSFITPLAVNKLFKMLIYPWAQRLAQNLLVNLQNLLLDTGRSRVTKDLIFCLAFLAMLVLGKNQTAVFELGILRKRRGEPILAEDPTKPLIGMMEAYIADLIIGLYQFRSLTELEESLDRPTTFESEAEKHSADFDMFSLLKENFTSAEKAGRIPSIIELPRDVEKIGDDFSQKNLKRLLFKFYLLTQESPREV